jgi:carbon monoxide dehydrogenase subunit G
VGFAQVEIEIAKEPGETWTVAGDFEGIGSWFPGIESCVINGDDRILKMMGLEITERLESRDNEGKVLVYAIVGGVPVVNHRATITVAPAPQGSRVTWDVEVEPDEMTELMRQTYQGALEALKAKLEA